MGKSNTLKRLRWILLIALVVIVISPGRSALFDLLEFAWEWLGGPNGAETNSTTVRNAGLVAAAVAAFYLTKRRIRAADRQALASHRQWIVASDALKEAEKSRFYTIDKDSIQRRNSEFYKGAEMLSSGEMFTRLAGIQILQALSTEDPVQFRQQTRGLLSAFIQFPPRLDKRSQGEGSDSRPDVQEAASVLAALPESHRA